MELEGRRTDAPPNVKRCLWSPSRWAISLASLLVASCGPSGPWGGGDGVDAGDAGVDASDGGGDPSAPPIDGLVAWYPMNAAITITAGTGTVVDASGHGHNGTCNSDLGRCPGFDANGRIGGAYTFDGIDDLFYVKSTSELEGHQGVTITAWLKRASDAPDACVINKSYQMEGDNSWQACINHAGALLFYSNDEGSATGDALDGGTVDTSGWHHLVLRWDGSRKATYVDGARVALTSPTKTVSILFDSADIDIGSDIDVNTAAKLESPFKGQIADVRIYNRALSPDEITALQLK